VGFETQDVERKVISILKILDESADPLGARLIAHKLKDHGIELGERAVRYHLKTTDEKGLTELIGRDGRMLTEKGREEIESALVKYKVGFAISRIELLAYRTDFDYENKRGLIPVNISFYSKDKFTRALELMKPVFEAGICVSDLVAVAHAGQKIGEYTVPAGKVGFGTVCSVTINGALLKAGIPMDSKFGGTLQMKDGEPLRFVELIHYSGSSLDPTEVFIKARMTAVKGAARTGDGRILANFREIPAMCRNDAQQVIDKLKMAGISGLLVMGNTSDQICEVPVELNRIGMILIGGMNPIAAVEEAGIAADNFAMSTVMNYEELVSIKEL